MPTPLYNTDVQKIVDRIPKTAMLDTDVFVVADEDGTLAPITKPNAKATLGIDDAEDRLDTLEGADTVDGSVLKDIKDNAENATYDNTDSGLTANTLKTAIDEVDGRLDTAESEIDDLQTAETAIKGTGYTEGSLKSHEDRLDTLEGVVDTNRLYSDSQYLALKAQYDAQQIALNASKAELYTDDPILQYGATEIIGDGYEADYTPIDVSANVVDGSLALEQKGLTITNLVSNGDFSAGTTGWVGASTSLTESAGVLRATYNVTRIIFGQLNILTSEPVTSKIFILVRARANKAGTFGIGLSQNGPGSAVTSMSFVELSTVWQIIPLIVTGIYGAGTVSNHLSFDGLDFNTAGDWIELDGNYGVSAYNLTTLGLSTITDTAILAKLLPYVDGTKNVGKMGVRVVGKNLFDKSKSRLGYYLNGTSAGGYSAGRYGTSGYIRVYAGQSYYKTSSLAYAWYDKNKNHLSGGVTTSPNVITASQDGFLRFTYLLAETDTTMLSLGSSALPYEPYQEQLTFLPAIGNSLPNGTADSIKTVADGWEHSKRVSTPAPVGSGVAVNTTNYPTAKNGGQWVNELTAGGAEIGVVGTDSTTGAGMLRFELGTPITTHYDLPLPTSGKTTHRFAGEEKIALYGTGLTFTENVLSVLSAVKFVAGEMTDITSLATITTNTVTFSGVSSTDVVYVKVEHDVDRPLGILEHTPAVSNTASRLAALEAAVFGG